jgi:plasmid stabilization system protein ParE
MGALKVIWRKKAILRFEQIAAWYAHEMGKGTATKFVYGIHNTIDTLSHSPQIGVVDEEFSTSKIKYYSFLSHPKYRIVYHFTKTTVYISAIRYTMMIRHD